MSKCITQQQSEKYSSFLFNSGVPILNPSTFLKAYNNYNNLSIRQKTHEANNIASGLLNTLSGTIFPRFYMLNLIIDKNSNKHAMLVVLDFNEQTQNYTLELFDPNGDMNPEDGYEGFAYSLVQDTREILEQNLKKPVEFIEIRQEKPSINIFGQGNCDALVLYFVTLRYQYSLEDAEKELDHNVIDIKKTNMINKMIVKKQLFL
jgi:hypothetical protein